MKNSLFQQFIPHLIAFAVFFILIFIYFSPTLSGKILLQSDIQQAIGSLKEASDYTKKTGEEILWSNSSFSGMPVWRGFGNNWLNYINKALYVLPSPVVLCSLGYIGFYILLYAFGANVWLCFTGAVAFTFSSFNFISIEAGHINKVFDMMLMAPVLAGIIMTYRGRWLAGAAVTSFFLAFHIYYAHIQISYYLLLVVIAVAIAELFISIKNKTVATFFKSSAILLVCAVIAILPNFSRLWTMAEYGKSTPRGGSELSSKKDQGTGLDKDYAMQWSYGVAETMTILIPNFHGGSSHEDLGTNSNVYKALVDNNVPKKEAKEYSKSMPLYWGSQPFTSGPVYFGAITCFLFVLSLFLLKGPLKWALVIVSLLSIVLAWGKNFEIVTDFFFYYVPMYNKFRSVTMILSIAQLTFPLLGFLALIQILKGEISKEQTVKAVKYTFFILSGITIFFVLFGTSLFDFTSESDASYKGQFPDWLMQALMEDRESFFRLDSLRSFIFISLTAGLLWFFVNGKVKKTYFLPIICILVIIDLWAVDKRYLDNSDFKSKKNHENEAFSPTEANQMILQDPDPYFRVFNTTSGITSDAFTSYFHKSVGGYSAIKLARYQDLIDSSLSRGNMGVFNMLNTKYFIVQDPQTKAPTVQLNPTAAGNAWFVSNYKLVNNADEEIMSLKNINPKEVAYIDKIFKDNLNNLNISGASNGSILLTSYHPHRLAYKSQSPTDGLGVFSEIYYQPGWKAYIDGKETPHMRANYVLRALQIPSGEHKIEFKFEPSHYFVGEKIALVGSIILVLFILSIILIKV